MLKLLSYSAFAVLATLLQSSFFAMFPVVNSINFVLLLMLYIAIKDDKNLMPFAMVSGCVLGLYSSYPFGTHIAALVSAALFARYVYNKILANHRFLPIMLLIAFSVALYNVVILFFIWALSFLKLFQKTEIWTVANLKSISISVLYSSILAAGGYLAQILIVKKFNLRFTRKN